MTAPERRRRDIQKRNVAIAGNQSELAIVQIDKTIRTIEKIMGKLQGIEGFVVVYYNLDTKRSDLIKVKESLWWLAGKLRQER